MRIPSLTKCLTSTSTLARFFSGALLMVVAVGCQNSGVSRRTGPSLSQGKAAMMVNRPSEAEKFLLKALKKNPRNPEVPYFLALTEMHKGEGKDLRVALDRVSQSIRLQPSASAWLLTGAIHEESGNTEEAIKAYKHGLQAEIGTNAQFTDLHRNLAVALMQQDDFTAAHGHFAQFVSQSGRNGTRLSDQDYVLWGSLLFQVGKDSEARAAWENIRDTKLRQEVTRL